MLPGFGDQATWGACCGHPHDPRTPEYDDDEEIGMSFTQTIYDLRQVTVKLEKCEELLDDVAEFCEDLIDTLPPESRKCQRVQAILDRLKYI